MNNDTVSGKFDQVEGKIKQSVGELTGDERMANSGAADQVKGAAKETWGTVKDAAQTTAGSTASGVDTRDTLPTDTSRTGHDVREKITSTAQNVKESIKNAVDDRGDRRSA